MKQKILILPLVFACFFTLGLVYRHFSNTKTTKSAERIFDCAATEVDRLQITRVYADGTTDDLAFIREMPEGTDPKSSQVAQIFSEWQMVGPVTAEGNTRLIKNIIGNICDLQNDRPYKENEGLDVLGIEPLVTEINLMAENKKWTIRLGKKEFESSTIAGIRSDSNSNNWKLFYAPNKINFLAKLPEKEFKNHLVSKMTVDNVQSLVLKKSGKQVFKLERQGDDFLVITGTNKGKVGGEETRKFVNRIGSLAAINLEKADIKPEECKKLSAAFELDLEGVAGRKETIKFSLPTAVKGEKEKRIRACNLSRKAIFLIHSDMKKYLETSPLALLK